MTEKGKTAAKCLLGAVATGVLIFIGRKIYKKSYEQALNQSKIVEAKVNIQLKKSGVDPEKVENEIDETNFVKSLMLGIAFNKDLENPAKVVDTNKWLDGEKGVGHVVLNTTSNKPTLEFYFEIPNWVGSYGPNLGDYVKGISNSVVEINQKNNLRFIEKNLGLYTIYTYQNSEGEDITSYWKINPEVYNTPKFMDEERGHDGLKKFFETAQKGNLTNEDKERLKTYLKDEVTIKYGGENPDVQVDIRIREIVPMLKYSYPVNTGFERGITYPECITMLKDIVEKVSVSKGKENVKFDTIIFHSQNKHGESDLASFYYLPDSDVEEVKETEVDYAD